jgi:transcriptional regulator with XRE-family HTH domain
VNNQQVPIDFNVRVGGNLQQLRKEKGMSQTDLAQELTERGFPFQQQTILKIEKGARPLKLEEAQVIAEILGVHPVLLSDYSNADPATVARAQRQNGLAGIAERHQQIAELEREIAHYNILVRDAERRLAEIDAAEDSDA